MMMMMMQDECLAHSWCHLRPNYEIERETEVELTQQHEHEMRVGVMVVVEKEVLTEWSSQRSPKMMVVLEVMDEVVTVFEVQLLPGFLLQFWKH